MDLNIAPDQSLRSVRVTRRRNAESVRSPTLAAVVHIDREGLGSGASSTGNRSRSLERGVPVRAASAAINGQRTVRYCFYPYPGRVIVVIQVPTRRRRAALHYEAETSLRVGISLAGNQGRRRKEIARGGEDRISRNLAATGHLAR